MRLEITINVFFMGLICCHVKNVLNIAKKRLTYFHLLFINVKLVMGKCFISTMIEKMETKKNVEIQGTP